MFLVAVQEGKNPIGTGRLRLRLFTYRTVGGVRPGVQRSHWEGCHKPWSASQLMVESGQEVGFHCMCEGKGSPSPVRGFGLQDFPL